MLKRPPGFKRRNISKNKSLFDFVCRIHSHTPKHMITLILKLPRACDDTTVPLIYG